MKKATSQDVANLAGVSQTTVSAVLNDSGRIAVSPETRDRVLRAAKQLDYRLPPRKKSGEKRAKTHVLLALTPTLTNPYYTEIIRVIEDYADTLQYRVIVCNTFRKPEQEKYYLENYAGKADGVIYTFLPSSPDLVQRFLSVTPSVIIGEKTDDMAICSIELSNIHAGVMLAEHLYSLGHRKFVFVSTPFNRLTLAREQRLQGIRRQLEYHGLKGSLIVAVSDALAEAETWEDEMPYEYTVGKKLTAELMKNQCDATAFIGVNDMTALGVLDELTERGIRVPQDISVCGFDNIFSARVTTPPLTTIDHHLKARCQAAVDLLISGTLPAQVEVPFVNKIEYTPQLIVRGSTGIRRD